MNAPNENSPTPEADRAIAAYGVPPPENVRQALRESLAAERETFRAHARLRDHLRDRLREREDRDR